MVAGTGTTAKKLVERRVWHPSIAVPSGSSEKVQRKHLSLVQEQGCHGSQKSIMKFSKAQKRASASHCLGLKNLPQATLLAAQRESKEPLPLLWSQEGTKRGHCLSVPCLLNGPQTTRHDTPRICFRTLGLNGTVIILGRLAQRRGGMKYTFFLGYPGQRIKRLEEARQEDVHLSLLGRALNRKGELFFWLHLSLCIFIQVQYNFKCPSLIAWMLWHFCMVREVRMQN